jgi:hypothetical protein
MTEGHHFADILVPERHRQFHAAIGKAHSFASAEIKPTIGKMQIAVANTRRQNLQQNFAAFGLRRRPLVALQRLTTNADLEHPHLISSRVSLVVARLNIKPGVRAFISRFLSSSR